MGSAPRGACGVLVLPLLVGSVCGAPYGGLSSCSEGRNCRLLTPLCQGWQGPVSLALVALSSSRFLWLRCRNVTLSEAVVLCNVTLTQALRYMLAEPVGRRLSYEAQSSE